MIVYLTLGFLFSVIISYLTWREGEDFKTFSLVMCILIIIGWPITLLVCGVVYDVTLIKGKKK